MSVLIFIFDGQLVMIIFYVLDDDFEKIMLDDMLVVFMFKVNKCDVIYVVVFSNGCDILLN